MKETTTQPTTLKEAYEAPTCETIEMQQEGVLCGSYGSENNDFSDGGYGWGWD